MRDWIATGILVGYLLMIGVTHGYQMMQPDVCSIVYVEGHPYNIKWCESDEAFTTVITSIFWPMWWTSHATQEILK